jgi:hypothetical protein
VQEREGASGKLETMLFQALSIHSHTGPFFILPERSAFRAEASRASPCAASKIGLFGLFMLSA